jgi:hypothetical protein
MQKFVAAAVICALTLGACGRISDSRLNPFNWFGGSEEAVVSTTDTRAALRDDILIDQVLSVEVDTTLGGAIISTIGLAPRQGFWEATLLRVPTEDPTQLAFEFRVKPGAPEPVGAQRSREILGGTFLTTQELGAARAITVVAAQNQRTTRR